MGDDGGISRRALLTGGAALGALLAAGGVGAAVEWDNPTFVRLRGGCGSTPGLPHSSYAVTNGTINSAAMRATLPWSVALPPGHSAGDGTPLLLCLPGRGSGPDAVLHAEGIPAWASAGGYRFAIATPGGGAATYWHPRRTGIDPLRYLVDDFIPMVEQRFGVGGDRQHRAAIGWSMGGFGVLLLAQQQRDLLGAVAAMSPAVFPSYSDALSGHPDTFDSAADWQRYGLWNHLADLRGTPVRIDCGGADPFAPTARMLLRRVPGAVGGITSGCHDNSFWRRTTPKALRFLASHLSGQI
ncbi:MAG: esterase [Frankiales bacterium]|nr:esterase [Frankiales bacterium]